MNQYTLHRYLSEAMQDNRLYNTLIMIIFLLIAVLIGLKWGTYRENFIRAQLGVLGYAVESLERKLAQDLVDGEMARTAYTHQRLGSAWLGLGNWQTAMQHYLETQRLLIHLYGVRHKEVALNLRKQCEAWECSGQVVMAIECYRQALNDFTHWFGKDYPLTSEVRKRLNDLGERK